MEQYMPIVWIGFAIFMLFCEGFTTQLVSIWFVLGSVCAAITTIFTSDITIQSAVFLCSVTCFAYCDTTACKTL
mgnify:CR=1 FL=1